MDVGAGGPSSELAPSATSPSGIGPNGTNPPESPQSSGETDSDPSPQLADVSTAPPRLTAWGRVGVVAAALIVAFFLVRLLGEPWPHFSPSYPDSFSYLKVAQIGPFRPKFFFTERPIGYPLLLWSVGRSSTLAVVAQTLIYIGAFWVLARVVTVELRSRTVAVLLVVFIAAIAIEPRNSMWNTLILSESFSISLAVLSIAAWWRAAARPTPRSIMWAWIATAAWILVRDTNVLPTVTVIVPAALIAVWVSPEADRALRRRMVAGARRDPRALRLRVRLAGELASHAVLGARRRRNARTPRPGAHEMVQAGRDAARRRPCSGARTRTRGTTTRPS